MSASLSQAGNFAGAPWHDACRPHRAARPEWHAERGNRAEAVGAQARRLPGDVGAPIMADDHGGPGLERIEQAHEIADQMKDRVLIYRLGYLALAVAAHIRCYGVEARCGERADLVAPGIPGFGKTVAQEHQRSLTLLGDVEADAVALDYSLGRLAHVGSSLQVLANAFVSNVQGGPQHAL